ncbi:MAG: hypothetical protein PVH92_08260 [Anaerolineales bacterium]|jgi:outer membrane biosynthesis protein TonB
MTRIHIKWTIVPLLLFLMILGACSTTPEIVATPTATPEPVEQQAEEPTAVEPEEEAPAVDQEADPQVEVKPTPRQGLVATDPTTVDLASGEPLLVEFFAFW